MEQILKQRVRSLRRYMCRYINGTRGVISLFLAILMVPFVSIAGALINAARVNSAIAVFDEALCNASNSTLGTYDKFLKERFGLLAMSQNTAKEGGGYTAENLISDTFKFYMEQNMEVLSNTFTASETEAVGIYPLSDPDILLTNVMEYGKYAVPTKLAIDGFSLDEIVKKLTEGTEFLGSVMDLERSTMDLDVKCEELQESMNTLRAALGNYEAASTGYADSYGRFNASVEDYNAMVDEMKREVQKCQEQVAAAESALAEADEENAAAAAAELDAARQALQETIAKYHNILASKRSVVRENKEDYVKKITGMAETIKTAGEAAAAAQGKFMAVVNQGVSIVSSVGDVLTECGTGSIDDDIKALEDQKQEAEKAGKLTDAKKKEYDDKITQLKDKKTNLKNGHTLGGAYEAGLSAEFETVEKFKTEHYQELFSQMYSNAVELRNSVRDQYLITDADEKLPGTAPYYRIFSAPLTRLEVIAIEEGLAGSVASSSFIALLKALIGFVKAIFATVVWYDPELCANINIGNYGHIGGLPSHRAPSEAPDILEEDRRQSEYYRTLLGSYSSSAFTDGSVNDVAYIVSRVIADIDTISENANNLVGLDFFKKLGRIIGAVTDILSQMAQLIQKMAQIISGTGVYQKLLLTGYIGYNTANRTTYSDSALTGASYDLPSFTSPDSGYAFYGAETEYIINGGYKEIDNQIAVFHWVYLIRFMFNLVYVSINSEVWTFVEAAAAATAPIGGIGAVILLAAYYIAEPFVDAVILVNGGEIPLLKLEIYLTPSGALNMVGEMTEITSTEIEELKKSQPDSDILDLFGIDYTQTLILIMLFTSSDMLLERLGDIIQMECSYNAAKGVIDVHGFDLAKSFTYLRASGSFTTNEFIRLSNESVLKSPKRVVYRGY